MSFNKEVDRETFNWSGKGGELRRFGGYYNRHRRSLELSLHAQVELARENIKRCREDIDAALARYLVQ